MPTYYPTADVRHTVMDGSIVLLDLRIEQYTILNRTATSMWQSLLLLHEPQQRLARLEQEFNIAVAQLAMDLDEFAHDCVARGYLQLQAPSNPHSPSTELANRGPLALSAWRSLVSTSYNLRRFGFSQTYRAYSCFKKPVAQGTSIKSLLERSQRAFSLAENFFVMESAPKDCLPRSLALYRFLLSAGIPADHIIGVRQYPFEAHAWVEFQGEMLFDCPSEARPYTQLSRL